MLGMKFDDEYGACNFIVSWDGESVEDLFDAITCARSLGDRFIQEKLIEYVVQIPKRVPRPMDIPAIVGRPIWAVDKQGKALIGMPGKEEILSVDKIREMIHS